MRLFKSITDTTSRLSAASSQLDVVLTVSVFAALLSLGVLFLVIWTTEQLPKSTEFVQTEHGTLHLSCLAGADVSPLQWAIAESSHTHFLKREALRSGVPVSSVKVCTVVAIGIPGPALASIQTTNNRNSDGKRDVTGNDVGAME